MKVKVGTGGKVSFYNPTGTVHVIADVVGVYGAANATTGALHHALTPSRILDTRKGIGAPIAPLAAGATLDLDVTGWGGVPGDDVSAVVLNVTVTNPTTTSFLKVWPSGEVRPNASSLNFVAGQTIPNLVIAKVGAGGKVSFFNPAGTVDVIADVVGWYGLDGAPEGAAFTAITPTRILDTRSGIGVPIGPISAGSTKVLDVTGVAEVPADDVSAVVMNVTATGATKATFLTIYPEGTTRPSASNLNVVPGETIANLVIAKVGDDGEIRIYNSAGAVHVIGDVVGWFGPENHYSDVRLLSKNEFGTTLRDATSVADASGAIHVAWRESAELLYRKIDRDGDTLIATVRTGWPIDSTGYGSRYVQLAPQPDGGVAILWLEGDAIMGARLDGAGRVAVAPKAVAVGSWAYLSAASDAAGNVHAIVHEVRQYPSTAWSGRIKLLSLTPDLTPRSATFTLTSRMASFATRYTGIDVEADGTVHVAWFDERQYPNLDRYDVHYARFGGPDPSVGAVVSALPGGYSISGDSAGVDNEGPKIDVDPSGRAHISWVVGHRVYYSSVDSLGVVGAMGVQVDVGAYQTATKYFDEDLAALPDGTAAIVFGAGSDVSTKLVRVRVDATGAVRVPALLIDLGTGSFGLPHLDVVGGEEIVVGRRVVSSAGKVFVTSSAAVEQPTDRPDLVVDDAHSTNTSTPNPPKEGTAVTMDVQVSNGGWVASPATTVEFRRGATLLGTDTVPSLAAEATTVVTGQWTVPVGWTTDPAEITVTVDPAGAVAETSEANNTVAHRVPVWLRPAGAGVSVAGLDETDDTAHEGYYPVTGFTARIVGTSSESGPLDVTVTAPSSSSFANFALVPPGTYTVTASRAGYASPPPQAITVTRNPSDPYQVTVSPSPVVTAWFDTWGDVSGTVTGGSTGLSGVTVRDLETGRTTTTDSSGGFTFVDLAAGTHHLAFQRTGYARALSVPVAVTVGGTADADLVMTPTTDAYVDVRVVTPNGTALADATVTILDDTTDAVLVPPCTTAPDGTCNVLVPGGTPFRIRVASDPAVYVTSTSGVQTVAAGDVLTTEVPLSYTVGTFVWATRSASVSSWVTDTYAPRIILTHWWNFWGNYHLDLDLATQSVAGVNHLRLLDVTLDGDAYLLEAKTLLPNGVFGAEEGGTQEIDEILDSDGAHQRSNLQVTAIRVVDTDTGAVYWQESTPTSDLLPANTHSTSGDRLDLSLRPDVAIGTGTIAVEIDAHVGFGLPGDPAWYPAQELQGYSSALQTIVWVPGGGLSFIARAS